MKRYTKCKQEKELSEFGPNKRCKDGLTSWCRSCCREGAQEYRENNKDKISAKWKERYISDPEKYTNKRLIAHYGITLYASTTISRTYRSIAGGSMFARLFMKKSEPLIPKEVDIVKLNSNVISLTGKQEFPANCWNATQVFFGSNDVRHTTAEEMEHWLAANTIHDPMKSCSYGTILVFRQGNLLIHTAVYVAPGILWHKRGVSGAWEFVTPKQAREIYFEADNFEYRLLKS